MATNVPAPWVYSNWITYGVGTPTRLSRLRSFIQEVSDRISQQSHYSIKGREVSPPLGELQKMLEKLREDEALEAERSDLSSGARLGWTQGFAKLDPGCTPGSGY